MSALEQAIADALREGPKVWPGVVVTADELRALLGRVDTTDGTDLGALCHRDLYLACALARGDRSALAAFEQRIIPIVGAASARVTGGSVDVREVEQVVRNLLFVGSERRAPAIGRYSGRGNLKAWVRVIAVREAYRLVRVQKRNVVSQDDQLFDVLTDSASDPQLEHLKRLYREKFKAAFAVAVTRLGRRERNALRLNVIDGFSIDEIGDMYKAHRATAARWLAKAREELLIETRKALAADLNINRNEVDSIIRLISSQLDMSLDSILKSRNTTP